MVVGGNAAVGLELDVLVLVDLWRVELERGHRLAKLLAILVDFPPLCQPHERGKLLDAGSLIYGLLENYQRVHFGTDYDFTGHGCTS